MGKRYAIARDTDGKWYIEMQEGAREHWVWVIIAGPFPTEDEAWDALDKLRED